MNRELLIQQLTTTSEWDICIIGGGATGLGTAVDAATRGFKTILFEQYDFAKGTSSKSTKLVHGGVRYLQQGNVKLVMEALKERGLLLKNAPHLVKNQKFVVPNYQWWEGPFYGIGLKIYDWMAGSLGLGPSQFLSKEETLALAPTLEPEGLRGGVIYHDGQFDDARLAINLAQTAVENNAVALNYFPVTGLLKTNNKTCGVTVKDSLSGKEYEIKSKVVINATGVFTDTILTMDNGDNHEEIIAPSQGIHLVLDKEFLPRESAIMIPHTDDGRVLFAVPWHNKVILGTTDTPVSKPTVEPLAQEEEIHFLISHIGRYLTKDPTLQDVKSIFAGLRPLVKGNSKTTASLSRDHLITISNSGLITITGGKWTTYRHMAEDVVDIAIAGAGLPEAACRTKDHPIHGAAKVDFNDPMYYFGSDQPSINSLAHENAEWKEKIHPELPYIKAEIIWAVRNEMCMTIEDALSRRTRALLLDANAAIKSAATVARIMSREMKQTTEWEEEEVNRFITTAANYLPKM